MVPRDRLAADFLVWFAVPCIEGCRLFFDDLFVLLLVLWREDGGNGATRDANLGPRRDLDQELLVAVLGPDAADDASDGEDLVPDLDALDQLSLLLQAAPLRGDQEQPEQGEDGDDHDQLGQGSSCGPPASRASAAAVKASSSPRSIACRAPAVSSSRWCKLCRLRSLSPSSSSWLIRWRT